MAPQNKTPRNDKQQSESTDEKAPRIVALTQYIKKLSFENPGAPEVLRSLQGSPAISIEVNVKINQINEEEYEVEIPLQGKASFEKTEVFNFLIEYAGIFKLNNVAEEHLGPVLMIQCPQLLFPFARQVVANIVREGGFPPLYVDPINFAALYNQRRSEIQNNQQKGSDSVN